VEKEMITIVTRADYEAIRNSFTDEEIRLKYGRLVIMSKEEYWNYRHPTRERKNKKKKVIL
jgi:hypothetical protein